MYNNVLVFFLQKAGFQAHKLHCIAAIYIWKPEPVAKPGTPTKQNNKRCTTSIQEIQETICKAQITPAH